MNSQAAALAASRFYIARAQRSRQFISMATLWAAGLNVSTGDIVQSNGLAWQARTSGVAGGAVPPTNGAGAAFTDAGGVRWLHLPLLLAAPEPI